MPLKGPEVILALLTRPVLPANVTLTVAVPESPFLQERTAPLTPLRAVMTSLRLGEFERLLLLELLLELLLLDELFEESPPPTT